MKYFCHAFVLFFLMGFSIQAQQVVIEGRVLNENGEGVPDVAVFVEKNDISGTLTDSLGYYTLKVTFIDSLVLLFQHVEYKAFSLLLNKENYRQLSAKVVLIPETKLLEAVEIRGKGDEEQASIVEIDPLDAKMLPSAFNDFNKVLSTLPGVISNNEFSSSYAVRGGNFDENLVYVNDIPIYRPFLVRSGQQEGLSFVNPDLVSDISFSSGGWQPKYGDKLSSNLNITYKNPKENKASMTLGLLGGSAFAALYDEEGTAGALVGIRHKNSKYLLNTLETSGEYFPSFTDVQVLLSRNLNKDARTTIDVLSSYARNRYLVRPESQETIFGTLSKTMKLSVYFQGNELMEYDTYQTGVKLSHLFSKKFVSDIILSGVYTLEREYYDIEGAYRLCDINGSGRNPNECITISGVGTNYRYARNRLSAKIFTLEFRNTYFINSKSTLEFGVGLTHDNIDDQLKEYEFSDSSDFITMNNAAYSEAVLSSYQLTAYIQNTASINSRNNLTYGVRFNYRSLNEQLLVSPRLQYAYRPLWERDIIFRAAVGFYQQPPFYRELRDYQGNVHKPVKAQSSLHNILGFDYNFKMWGRDFKWVTEAYYKHLKHVIPYSVDNVRIRYAAENNATAYAAGLDVRISGEFIEGAQSWLSLGVLTTEEKIENDERGYIRRPSDQRVNVGIYFQDHIPNDPSIRMYLSLLFGSGLPFGPPNNEQYRNAFTSKTYRRVDIGFSKIIDFEGKEIYKKVKSIWISAEILNLMGTNNVLSYTWIEDVNSQHFAIPNTLSTRFLNLKVTANL